MPNLLSENYDNALQILDEYDVNVIRIGDGDKIVEQYPKAQDDVYSNQRVFLLTNSNNISLPNFEGWTRKDIIAYWNLTNLPITMDGYGVAYEQSVLPNTIVDGSTEIIIKLHDINYVEPVENEIQVEETPE